MTILGAILMFIRVTLRSCTMTLEDLINSGDPREIKRALSVKMFLYGSSRTYISEILDVTDRNSGQGSIK